MKPVLLFSLLPLLFCPGCSPISQPEFRRISNLRVIEIGPTEITLGLGMTYYNPNEFTVTVKETAVKVFLDSAYLGEFLQDTSISVGENSDFTVPLSGTISLPVFLKFNLKNIHKTDVKVRAEGETKIGKGGVFITRKVAYEGQHRLEEIRLK